MPRVKIKKEVEASDRLKYSKEDFRFATPKIVADYRADRLKCDVLCEIGAGVGFQTIAFARKCKKVYAVEIDKRKVDFLKKNLKILGIKNVEVIHGDGLEVDVKADVYFVDTERDASEDVRKLSSIKPDVKKLVKKFKNICIEVPPQIRDLDLDCEKEYVSVNNELNRLNLYFGNLKKYKINVLLLPENKRLELKGTNKLKESRKFNHKYIYEINPAVVRSGLVNELSGEVFKFEKKVYLVSNKKLNSPFLVGYKVLVKCSKEEVKDNLNEFGKVVLKYSVPDYWKERNRLEAGLKGSKKCYVFVFNDFILCEKLNK